MTSSPLRRPRGSAAIAVLGVGAVVLLAGMVLLPVVLGGLLGS